MRDKVWLKVIPEPIYDGNKTRHDIKRGKLKIKLAGFKSQVQKLLGWELLAIISL